MKRACFLATAILLGAFVVGLPLWFFFPPDVPTFSSVRDHWTPSDAYLLDRNGVVIDQERVDFQVRRFEWTPLEAVSPALTAALIDGEDRRFWEHSGIDWAAVLGAMRDNSIAQRRRGASTITMQVAKLLEARARAAVPLGTWERKFAQTRMARALDARWTKRQILEAYLNLIYFRGELQGIGAASQVLAGKAPSGLTLSESLVLAALVPAPAAHANRVVARACSRAAARRLTIDCPTISATASVLLPDQSISSAADTPTASASTADGLVRGTARTPLVRSKPALQNALAKSQIDRQSVAVRLAPNLAHSLLRKPGERIQTTLDIEIQRLAINTLTTHLANLTSRNVRDGAVLVVDNDTGNVLAYVGSAGPQSSAREVDGVRAPRQAGSTLKPFLYELALERHYLTAASLLNDAPIALETASGIYLPQDYDRDFKGLVSVRTALASSLNVPAVRALMVVGVEPFRDRLHALGYTGITQPGEFYGYSLALGSAEVSLWEQVQAYRTLARGGQWAPIQTQTNERAPQPARDLLNSNASFVVSDILSDRAARSVTFGLDNHLNTPFWSAVKTGTSKDMRDNWCIGFSRRFTVGVWVGNFEGDSMHDVSGVTGAAPVWQQIMLALHARVPSTAPAVPEGVTTTFARFAPAVEPARTELFLSANGGAPARTSQRLAESSNKIFSNTTIEVAGEIARISSPANGMVIAVDPDIPLQFQRVPLAARGVDQRMVLRLNGAVIGKADREVMWSPARGSYLLALEDATGHTLDSAHFIVR